IGRVPGTRGFNRPGRLVAELDGPDAPGIALTVQTPFEYSEAPLVGALRAVLALIGASRMVERWIKVERERPAATRILLRPISPVGECDVFKLARERVVRAGLGNGQIPFGPPVLVVGVEIQEVPVAAVGQLDSAQVEAVARAIRIAQVPRQ